MAAERCRQQERWAASAQRGGGSAAADAFGGGEKLRDVVGALEQECGA